VVHGVKLPGLRLGWTSLQEQEGAREKGGHKKVVWDAPGTASDFKTGKGEDQGTVV